MCENLLRQKWGSFCNDPKIALAGAEWLFPDVSSRSKIAPLPTHVSAQFVTAPHFSFPHFHGSPFFLFLAIEHKPADGGGREVTRRQDGNHKNEMSFPLSLRGLQQQQEMQLQSRSLFGEGYSKFGKLRCGKKAQKFRFCFSF